MSQCYFNLPTEEVFVCQWIHDTSMALLSSAGLMNVCNPINQCYIRCYRLRIFTYWNTEVHSYFCSAEKRRCKCQVCNCVDINCLLVASRVIAGLIAPLHSIEYVFVFFTITLRRKNNIIFSVEVSLFQTLSMHKRKQCASSTNTKLLSVQCDILTGFCLQFLVI